MNQEAPDYWKMAREKFPGPDYYMVLKTIHHILRPKYYLEIGIASGTSLSLALENSYAVGVDPEINITHAFRAWTKIMQMTSDQFFESYYGDNFDMIFLDGLHLYEAIVKDFCHAEELCNPNSLILIHDTIPLSQETATSDTDDKRPSFWTGDVWKIIPALIKGRPDLDIFTIPCMPSGLTVVRGFSEKPKGLSQDIIDEFKTKDFDWINSQWKSIYRVIPNDINVLIPLFQR